MVWPFKWNLLSSTFTWYYLYLSILQNEIWDSSWILILGTCGSERAKVYETASFADPDWTGSLLYKAKNVYFPGKINYVTAVFEDPPLWKVPMADQNTYISKIWALWIALSGKLTQ